MLLEEPARRAPQPGRRRGGAVALYLRGWLRVDLPQWWLPALIALSCAYAIWSYWALTDSWLTRSDGFFYGLQLVHTNSASYELTSAIVFLGRRVAATLIIGTYVLYRAVKMRSWQPLVLFGLAFSGFVASVAAIKYSTGRIGPRYTSDPFLAWSGGNIFPSGHVVGAVVLYGVAALIAPAAHRRVAAAITVAMSLAVGFGTVAIDTHWFSDVVGGWLNGAIVLLLAWAVAPVATARLQHAWRRHIQPRLAIYQQRTARPQMRTNPR